MAYELIPGIQQDHRGRYFQTAVYPNGKAIRIDLARDYTAGKREETFDDRQRKLEADWEEAIRENIKRNLARRQVRQQETGKSRLRARSRAGVWFEEMYEGLDHGQQVEWRMGDLRAEQARDENGWVAGQFTRIAAVDWMEVTHVD